MPAQAAEVVSSNIVGYEKITLTPGLNMIGNQFLAVGGTTFQNINQMFKDQSGMISGGGADEADTIMVWDGSAYNDIYYFDEWQGVTEWYNVEDLDDPTTDTIQIGSGFWFKHIGETAITTTFAGEVATNAEYQVAIHTGLNMVANPYPMAICPNGDYFEVDGAVSGGGADEADTILVWDGSAYNDIYYFDEWQGVTEWYNVENLDDPVDTSILKPAMGFWYKHIGTGGTMKFKKPF